MQAFALTPHAYFTTSLSVFFGSDFYRLEHNWSSATGWANPANEALPLQRSWQAGREEEPGDQACAARRAVLSGCWWRLEVWANNFWVGGDPSAPALGAGGTASSDPAACPAWLRAGDTRLLLQLEEAVGLFFLCCPFSVLKPDKLKSFFLLHSVSILQEFQCSQHPCLPNAAQHGVSPETPNFQRGKFKSSSSMAVGTALFPAAWGTACGVSGPLLRPGAQAAHRAALRGTEELPNLAHRKK